MSEHGADQNNVNNVRRLIQPGSIEEVLEQVQKLQPEALLVFVRTEDGEHDVVWNGLNLMEIAYALRAIGIRLDQHILGHCTKWTDPRKPGGGPEQDRWDS